MKTSNLTSSTHFKALAKVIDYAERQGFQMDEYTEGGYNSNSGYVYVYSEDWPSISFGISDFAYLRGEEVECILNEPFEGMEFFGKNPQDCEAQYRTWAREMLLDGMITESDILEF